MRYVCSLPNAKGTGGPREFVSDNPDEIEAWCRREDRPGRGVFDCVSPLKPGAQRRSLDTIGAIVGLHVDIDPKDIEESMNDADRMLYALRLPPSEIRTSGRGRHVYYYFKEAIDADDTDGRERAQRLLTRLTEYLCGDPAVAHFAALMRHPGTHNTKEGAPLECAVLHRTGATFDITEIENWLDIYESRPIFTRKPKPGKAGNGRDGDGTDEAWRSGEVVDVEERLAAIAYQGPGNTSIHTTWKDCLGSLLRDGTPLQEAVERIMTATEARCQNDPDRSKWWRRLLDIAEWYLDHEADFINNLDPEEADKWEEHVRAGDRPRLVYRKDHGLQVRGKRGGDNGPQPDVGDSGATGEDRKAKAGKRSLVLTPFVAFDPAALPPRAWLYGKHYQRRTASLTAGPGGFGKSSLVLCECLAMATGRNLLNEQPSERLRVWVHNGEDPLDEIHRRIAAICQHYRIPMEELQGWLWLTSGTEFPLKVAKGYANLVVNETLLRHIANAITDNRIDLAAFDPLVTLHSVREGDPGNMDAVVRSFTGIADATDTSNELSHHVRKPAAGADSDYDVHDIRGVMAITDAVRSARVLNRMGKSDADAAGIDDIARRAHFRVDKVKGNYSVAQAATWRRFVSVELPNTDDVGVVVPWDYPGQGMQTPEKAAADQKAEHVFLQLLDKFLQRGTNVGPRHGPNYAPALFEGEKEAKAAKVSKAALKAAMTRLLDAGRIRTEPTGRSDRGTHRLVPWTEPPK